MVPAYTRAMTLTVERAERLDRFLAGRLPMHSRSRLARLIQSGEVLVEGQARKPSFGLRPGMVVELQEVPEAPAHDLAPADIPLTAVFEDAHLLVVNKPRGMATHPAPGLRSPTLVNALLARSHGLSPGSAPYRPGIVHRLDKDTTGLIVVAKSERAHRALASLIADRNVERLYVALVEGSVEPARLAIDAPIRRNPADRLRMHVHAEGKPAKTHLAVLARLDARSLVAVRLETGRTHQIRVHLAAAGWPVVGDPLYGRGPVSDPLQLHSILMSFKHPLEAGMVEAWAEPPADFILPAMPVSKLRELLEAARISLR